MNNERMPAAFRHKDLEIVLDVLTDGLLEQTEATEAIIRLLANVVSVLKALRASGEKSGFAVDLFMEQFDNIIEVLEHSDYKIVTALIENTELDE
jgi:hypothetical protein